MLYNPGRVACHDRIRGDASRYDGIYTDNRIASYHKLALIADNGRSETDPRSILDSDGPSLRRSLKRYGDGHIFKRVVMIHDEHGLAENDIASNVDSVYR